MTSGRPVSEQHEGRLRSRTGQTWEAAGEVAEVIRELAEASGIRDVSPPLTPLKLRPLGRGCEIVQFSELPSEAELRRIAWLLRKHPDVELRAYASYDGSITDLEFLRFFPDLRGFSVDGIDALDSLDGLRHLPASLTSLGIGRTRRRLSLRPLERFPNLRELFLEGQTKDIEVLAGLSELRRLQLRSVTLPDLSLLHPLQNLEVLELKLGGTRDLSGIEDLPLLRSLEIWMVRGLTDLSPVASCTQLESLFLQALKNVTRLPDLSALHELQSVHLETMKGLDDLTALLTAPALREVLLVDMGHLQPEQVGVLAAHPALQRATVGLGSDRKNRAARALLDLPRT